MVIERSNLKTELKSRMREGKGEVSITPLGGAQLQKHLRLLSEITIPPGSSIGQHPHVAETEYYIILEGSALVDDNGTPVNVRPGDIVITNGGATHSIEATGTAPLRMIAVIVTDE
ncbi:MAG: cupin domain-containing protein [Spirochaetia bacterium]|jgi:mannose-6-phosphate isomerase-like protein (cupin superfamily)|nr:cupin domain-containing protein [Spirochaetia bacterium]